MDNWKNKATCTSKTSLVCAEKSHIAKERGSIGRDTSEYTLSTASLWLVEILELSKTDIAISRAVIDQNLSFLNINTFSE